MTHKVNTILPELSSDSTHLLSLDLLSHKAIPGIIQSHLGSQETTPSCPCDNIYVALKGNVTWLVTWPSVKAMTFCMSSTHVGQALHWDRCDMALSIVGG